VTDQNDSTTGTKLIGHVKFRDALSHMACRHFQQSFGARHNTLCGNQQLDCWATISGTPRQLEEPPFSREQDSLCQGGFLHWCGYVSSSIIQIVDPRLNSVPLLIQLLRHTSSSTHRRARIGWGDRSKFGIANRNSTLPAVDHDLHMWMVTSDHVQSLNLCSRQPMETRQRGVPAEYRTQRSANLKLSALGGGLQGRALNVIGSLDLEINVQTLINEHIIPNDPSDRQALFQETSTVQTREKAKQSCQRRCLSL
jgi:hypothetical protein